MINILYIFLIKSIIFNVLFLMIYLPSWIIVYAILNWWVHKILIIFKKILFYKYF